MIYFDLTCHKHGKNKILIKECWFIVGNYNFKMKDIRQDAFIKSLEYKGYYAYGFSRYNLKEFKDFNRDWFKIVKNDHL